MDHIIETVCDMFLNAASCLDPEVQPPAGCKGPC